MSIASVPARLPGRSHEQPTPHLSFPRKRAPRASLARDAGATAASLARTSSAGRLWTRAFAGVAAELMVCDLNGVVFVLLAGYRRAVRPPCWRIVLVARPLNP